MASIYEVSNIISSMCNGFERSVLDCMDINNDVVADCVREQLSCGQDGKGRLLNPTYDNDPYFNEDGFWKGKAEQYKKWKKSITPPVACELLHLPARPEEVPNLFITGVFHDSIKASVQGEKMMIETQGFQDGQSITSKYGEQILMLGERSIEYFNAHFLRPWLSNFFKNCGYK